eukprot:CAMPEP_0168280852 /NCGR_PEP_ID=MMETSP0141_2-20121125/21380_1 /TAXON_ID=44445 /ORGANISM="Pseudo-nitzschia australis, Strain 10249 10 AB" /LENGTH=264 /DNA_ID=CAMNT_0008224189 /DNA_START=399 /DNA_END=1194 /DNA_ORIENTATION=-
MNTISTTTRCALSSVPFLASITTSVRALSMFPSATAFVVNPTTTERQQEQRHSVRINSSSSINNNNNKEQYGTALFSLPVARYNDVKPTWEYVPYDPKNNNKNNNKRKKNSSNNGTGPRSASTWTVPKHVRIPEDKLEFSFVRSSGSGGQNVNKLSTKVELRIDLLHEQHASWMPREVQNRLREKHSNRISKEGILTITSQEHRTQGRNRTEAVNKLRAMVLEAWPRPKIRRQRTGVSRAAKARNKEFKKKRSETKQNRKKVDW